MDDKTAVVEFENDSSVDADLRKKPIRFSESKLSRDIKKLKLDELETGQVDSATAAEKEIKQMEKMVKKINRKMMGCKRRLNRIMMRYKRLNRKMMDHKSDWIKSLVRIHRMKKRTTN